ncbi:MAG: phosphoglycerate kinase [Bdellovibrio sp. CG12_big_fil_rev_8_21_14_0_65_39_13]|nr:MAG: phosphoglycerate kinase [Bdellovibrio sp. CG22_combo_CG10-13_8_21_14_all_39_27]PIQ58152.1 MAG: phosphoglycerate kinase [Bdellovibrio sp. CG12_big_fil_rev_8_21_14_0_65_39_13]PIR34314.1 MAG: phosphoglycerate kinase [Bdellovibrio sp. CG11_big_fil_rev_8_21_14_0_20_39_38]
MALKYVDELELNDKKVIARFDFNVPLDKNDPTRITDTTRIDEALGTIEYILLNGASKLILMSHLGRPDGKPNPKYSLEPVAKYLAEKLKQDVVLTESCTDAGIKTLLSLPETKIVLLQNLRFHAEEEANDPDFCRKLASYADIYINDAFGTAHRKHASTYGINAFFKNRNAGGFLLKREIKALEKVVENPAKPFVAIVGGAKVSDKIKIIERLLTNVNHLLIGGAMAYPFLKAKGITVGKSLCADEDVALAKKILSHSSKTKVVLPIDHIVSSEFGGAPEVLNEENIPADKMGLDIGPKTLELYRSKLHGAKTVLWNGPMGLFENADFAKGTMGIAHTLAELPGAFTLVGGGDSVSAVNKSGVAEKMSHVSTGGGASLEFIEDGTLPGIQALKFGV